ncbi:MAG: DUF6600 domain-containing protein [Pyrinomonadaceae bacterium]
MRYTKTPPALALLLLLTLTLNSFVSAAATTTNVPVDDDDDGYEETARVVRVSMLRGDVSLRRAGGNKWEKASLNLPLVEGDRLATGPDARIEIQIDARNFIRLGAYATLDIVTLRDEGIALSLPEGTATLRLARFDRDREYFEIDAPKTTLAAEQKGSYRLDVLPSGNVRATVRDGGRARLYSETSGFTLRDGRAAELVYNQTGNSDEADWELSAARSLDDWDTWVDDRDRYLAARLRHEERDRYYDKYVWGAEELDAYGDWVQTNDYGYVWRPHVTVINNYNDWAPYRYGRWNWCPPYGWTWVGDEPWGWAPYHYGRWVYINNYWGWAPRGYASYGRRSWWRPALVAFVNINIGNSYGDHIAWYPLAYRQRDPHSNYYRRLAATRAIEQRRIANLERINPIYQRAVTTLPAREFGKGFVRAHPATKELALRAISTDPVRGKLPLRPIEADSTNGGNNPALRNRRTNDGLVIRNPTDPARTLPQRPTGAATRKPGLALDGELRRERIFNHREPRFGKIERPGEARDGNNPNNGGNGERDTGAVTRPARPIRALDSRDGNSKGDKGNDARTDTGVPAMKRPVRQIDPGTQVTRPPSRDTDGGDGERLERRVKSIDRKERPNDGDGAVTAPDYQRERPARPDPGDDERAGPQRREERRAAPPAEHRAKPPREDRPEPPRREKSERQDERPAPQREERPAPRREERSAPREERPAPAPQREERRADPPRERSAPPASPMRGKMTDKIDNH